jgi:multidrug resistance protein, MATE family
MIHVGMSNAATIRTGRADGEADARALRDGAWVALGLSQGIGLFIIAVFVLAPEPLIRLFLDPADPVAPRIIGYASTLLLCAAAFQVADAAQVMALGLLRGIRDTRVPMLIAAMCYWGVGIPASYAMAFWLGWGGVGLWLGLVVGLSLTAIALLMRFAAKAPRP